VSALANRFVKDPHEVVKPGQIVQVKVIEVDVKRQRIALTMRLNEVPAAPRASPPSAGTNRVVRDKRAPETKRDTKRQQEPPNAMALAFAKLKK
jgi:uncharacterized protein